MHLTARPWLWFGCLVALGAGSGSLLAQNHPCGNNETVVLGDTLYEIAQRCNTTVEKILRLNPEITDPDRIAVGITLAIPGAEQGTALRVAELSTPEDGDRDDDDGPTRRIIGTVTDQGVECPALRASDGTLYTLTGSGVAQLQPGQRVYVEGTEVEMSFCQQGTTLAVKRMEKRGQRQN